MLQKQLQAEFALARSLYVCNIIYLYIFFSLKECHNL